MSLPSRRKYLNERCGRPKQLRRSRCSPRPLSYLPRFRVCPRLFRKFAALVPPPHEHSKLMATRKPSDNEGAYTSIPRLNLILLLHRGWKSIPREFSTLIDH